MIQMEAMKDLPAIVWSSALMMVMVFHKMDLRFIKILFESADDGWKLQTWKYCTDSRQNF